MLSREVGGHADESAPRNIERFSVEGHRVKESRVGRIYSSKAVKAVAGISVLAVSASVFYRVRELLAALVLFSFLFGVVIVAVLILWLVERGTHEAAVRLETHLAHIPTRHNVPPTQVHANHIHKSSPWN
jgi:hypothetical protein